MSLLDVVLVVVLVAAATAYLTWKLALRQAGQKSPPVIVGATLAKAMAGRQRQQR